MANLTNIPSARRNRHVSGWPASIAAACIGVVVGLWIGAPGSVDADNWGGPRSAGVDCDATVDSQCVANNYVHGVNFSSTLTGEWTDALEETIAYYNDNSELVVWGSAPYTTTNDVRAATVVTANGLWGWTRCVSTPTQTGTLLATPPPFAIDTKWCIPQLIYFNDQYEGYYNTLNRKTAVACHELGHTMGLRHRSTTPVACMRSTPINRSPEPDLVYPSPGGHDLNHLNAFYD